MLTQNQYVYFLKAFDSIAYSYTDRLLSVPKFTENLYCICLSIDLRYILVVCVVLVSLELLKQMQYRFAVNFGTLST